MWKGYTDLPAAGYIYRATIISAGGEHPTKSYPACITSPRCSNGGGVERSRAEFNNSISVTPSMHSRFVSTTPVPTHGDCAFITEPNTRLPSVRRPMAPLFVANRCELAYTIRIPEDVVDQLFYSSEMRLVQLLPLMAHFGKDRKLDTVIPKICQDTLAEMISTMRSRASFFMNTFRTLGFL